MNETEYNHGVNEEYALKNVDAIIELQRSFMFKKSSQHGVWGHHINVIVQMINIFCLSAMRVGEK